MSDFAGRFLAGPIDLNNDGRGDSLSVGGGTGAALYVLGSVGGSPVAAPIVLPANATQIRALASVGNIVDPLLDSYAVNIVDGGTNIIRLCYRRDRADTNVLPAGFGFTCPTVVPLRTQNHATIAGR